MGDDFKVVAIDVGGTNLRATAINDAGTVLHRVSQRADRLRDGDPVAILGELITSVAEAAGGGIDGAVIGVPGILDRTRRGVLKTPLLPALQGIGLADRLQDKCNIPVFLDHDATLQTRGEALRGSAIGHDLILGVYFGTGVGGAFIDHGQLMGGVYRMQLGHVPLRGEGRIGTGGATDCVEAYASGLVLQSLASQYGVPVNELFALELASPLREALKTFVHDQALTVAMAMTLTDPEVVVIGGGVTDMAGYPFDELVSKVNECLSPVLGKHKRPVVRATLGTDAASWGALSLVHNVFAHGGGARIHGPKQQVQ
jgi:predicted NBD/HSP70 family sugar kinase